MKSFVSAFIIWSVFCSLLSAQHAISGITVDPAGNPLVGVNIRLLTTDSLLISGATSGTDGSFVLKNIRPNNYLLSISSVGYKSYFTGIYNISGNIKLEKLVLKEESVLLDEVAVTAQDIIKVDRQILFPTASQVSSSTTGYDMLSRMMLPGITVNVTLRKIESIAGKIEVRINDVVASEEELLAVAPARIVKIEYIDIPGARYNNAAGVINIITRKDSYGISTGFYTRNAVFTGFSQNNVYTRMNSGNSEFGLNYGLDYNRFSGQVTRSEEYFQLKGDDYLELNRRSRNILSKNLRHNFSLSYNWTEQERQVFNFIVRNSISSPRLSGEQDIEDTYLGIPVYSRSLNKDKNYTPVADLYYYRNLGNGQTLTANAVGTYIHTDYSRDYTEYLKADNSMDNEYYYTTKGKKYSFIGETNYEKVFASRTTFSAGAKYSQAYTNNRYNTGQESTLNDMNTSDLYLYAQLGGRLKRVSYHLGLGGSRQFFNEGNGKYTFYTFRPVVSLMYPVSSSTSLRYTFSVNPSLPSLSMLSDFDQWRNKYEVYRGNPSIKPYRTYFNQLMYSINKKRFNLMVGGYYQLNHKQVMDNPVERVDEEARSYFVYTSDNQKSFQHIQARFFAKGILWENYLTLSVRGAFNRYISNGKNYSHIHNDYLANVQLDGNYNNWLLSIFFNTGMDFLSGHTLFTTEPSANLSLRYKYKSIDAGIGVMNPFLPKGNSQTSRFMSGTVEKKTWSQQRHYGNMVSLTLIWNFNSGRKHQAGQKRLNNVDSDSGIVK